MGGVIYVLVGVPEPGSESLPVPVKNIVVKPGLGFGGGSSVVKVAALIKAFYMKGELTAV